MIQKESSHVRSIFSLNFAEVCSIHIHKLRLCLEKAVLSHCAHLLGHESWEEMYGKCLSTSLQLQNWTSWKSSDSLQWWCLSERQSPSGISHRIANCRCQAWHFHQCPQKDRLHIWVVAVILPTCLEDSDQLSAGKRYKLRGKEKNCSPNEVGESCNYSCLESGMLRLITLFSSIVQWISQWLQSGI